MQRILVIDDDPAVTSLLKRGLSYEGFAVETAQSGAEGLAIARERSLRSGDPGRDDAWTRRF